MALAEPLAEFGGLYATHMRTEFAGILDAMDEAFRIGRHARVPVAVSHLKCAGPENWGRSTEVLHALERAGRTQAVGCDAYPYTAGSSMLDLAQVTDRIEITITWSEPYPEVGGRSLKEIAARGACRCSMPRGGCARPARSTTRCRRTTCVASSVIPPR